MFVLLKPPSCVHSSPPVLFSSTPLLLLSLLLAHNLPPQHLLYDPQIPLLPPDHLLDLAQTVMQLRDLAFVEAPRVRRPFLDVEPRPDIHQNRIIAGEAAGHVERRRQRDEEGRACSRKMGG
jgi:hypothetical protein